MCQIKSLSLFHIFFLSTLFCSTEIRGANIPLPLGIVFGQGSPEVQSAFKHALLTFTLNITTNPRDLYRFTAYVDTINTADAFKLSKLICNQFSRGIYAMVGSMNSDSFHTYHAFANTFHMPLITPWYPLKESKMQNANDGKSSVMDYATRLKPDFSPAILDTIRHYGWKEVIYIYTNNEGLGRLQTLFHRPSAGEPVRVKIVKKVASSKDAVALLQEVEKQDRYSTKYVILDVPTPLAKEIITAHVQNIHLGRRNYAYLIPDLAFDDIWESEVPELSAINVTSFRMVDSGRRYVSDFLQRWKALDPMQFPGVGREGITANAAFMWDAMLIIKDAFGDILTDNPYAFSRFAPESACESGSDFLDDVRPFEYGKDVNQHLRRVQTEGLTGNIQFHDNGTRKYFTVDVVELRENSVKAKIAQWSDYSGFRLEPSASGYSGDFRSKDQKEYVVSMIVEEPFLTVKPLSQRKSPSDLYTGYMKDLADILFKNLGLSYRIELVKDGKYGEKVDENWNGIMGEIIRKDVDLAIAPLSVTAERERVVEFTKPFLTQGISILAYKPKKTMPGMFSFLSPFSEWVWLTLLCSYFGVSLVFYIIYRLQHQAEQVSNPTATPGAQMTCFKSRQNGINPPPNFEPGNVYLIQRKKSTETKSLPISNFFWLSLSILTNGNPRISKSVAGKFAGTVWWLFALILISIYTGNYISIRMKNRSANPIRNAGDLVDRRGFHYGTVLDGATFEFFRKSENQVYRAMYEHMTGPLQLNFRTADEGIAAVRSRKGKYVFLLQSSKAEYVSNRRPCNTVKIADIADFHYGIALPIGSPLTEMLNMEILKVRETGVLRTLEEKWWNNKFECEVATKVDALDAQNEDELSLGNLAGIFYILLAGLGTALVVSLCESFCSKKEKSKSESGNTLARKPEHFIHDNNQHQHPNAIDGTPLPHHFCDISPSMHST